MINERFDGDLNTAIEWAVANRDRYQIATVEQRWDLSASVTLTFRECPTAWFDTP